MYLKSHGFKLMSYERGRVKSFRIKTDSSLYYHMRSLRLSGHDF